MRSKAARIPTMSITEVVMLEEEEELVMEEATEEEAILVYLFTTILVEVCLPYSADWILINI